MIRNTNENQFDKINEEYNVTHTSYKLVMSG